MKGMVGRISRPKYYFRDKTSAINQGAIMDISFVQWEKKAWYKNNTGIINKIANSTEMYETSNESTNIKMGIASSVSSIMAVEVASMTNGYNAQTIKYVNAITEKQNILNQRNEKFLAMKCESGENLKATLLRNKADWMEVKRLVVRDELMKLQIGEMTDLPLTEGDVSIIREQIAGRDLSDFSDAELVKLIDAIMKPDEQMCLDAFKLFKDTGTASPYFQQNKLDLLKEYLETVDLDKPTAEQFKKLMDNFWEKLEIHHRTSISQDAHKQSDINNLDTLNTTNHDMKHVDTETGKINYKRPLKEEMLDRQAELEQLNKQRVIKKELQGIGITLAVAAGTGFTIGFIMSLAQTGISPHCLKHAFVSGSKSAAESSAIAIVGYGIARTVGATLSESLTEVIVSKIGENVAEELLKNIGKMCTMGIVGTLSIMVTSVYQFVKLKIQGYSTKESLIRVGKSAALSLSMLALAIIAQGIWGGPAGIIVSVTAGIIVTGVSAIGIIHDREIRKKVHLYLIELSYPQKFAIC